jgi:hypothetical protein
VLIANKQLLPSGNGNKHEPTCAEVNNNTPSNREGKREQPTSRNNTNI